jgi:hypothetical protein
MRLLLAAAALSTAFVATPLPIAAQTSSSERVLTIFGEDKCPRDTICVRAPESERYRIPKEFRDRTPKPSDQPWSNRVQSMEYSGASGTGSCTPVGAGGWTGCYAKMLRQAQQERKAEQQGQDLNAPR